jgi:hypothetical protein
MRLKDSFKTTFPLHNMGFYLYLLRGKRTTILPVRDDRIGLLDGDLRVVFLQILQADL